MRRWLAAAAGVLLLGLATGAVVYVAAEEDADSMGFEETRAYRHELERFGGKANVLFDQWLRWFSGLWHGKALGVTIAWIGVLLSLGIVVAGHLFAVEDRK